MKQYATIIGIAIVIGLVVWTVSAQVAKAPVEPSPTATSTGTTVIATTTPPAPNTSNTLAIGDKSTIHGTVIRVTGPVEDSRCPIGVQCVWAGTVGVHVAIDSYKTDFTFLLNKPQTIGNATITLTGVTPAQRASTQPIQPGEYRFTFSVVPKATPPPATSGVSGRVLLGPVCPVQSVEPNPSCDPQPYETNISVSRFGSSAIFATGKSDADGVFKFSLPPGSYTLTASGGRPLPRCGSVDVTVVVAKYATTTISCDTGIR